MMAVGFQMLPQLVAQKPLPQNKTDDKDVEAEKMDLLRQLEVE